MKKMATALIASTLLTASALGADLDVKKSVLNWKGTKVTGKHVGTLKFKSGSAKVEDGKLKGGEFVVDMNSLAVTDLTGEWADKFIGHMKSADFFEVSKHPTSKLVVKSVKGNTISGDLTIKGKTHPIKFAYEKNGDAYVGDFTFDRTKYDMIYNSGNFFKDLGDKVIHNEVVVNFKFYLK